jgi:hypothetical protein
MDQAVFKYGEGAPQKKIVHGAQEFQSQPRFARFGLDGA